LRKLSFRRLSVRPQHPQTKPEEQAVFKAASLVPRPVLWTQDCVKRRPS
jgi:hypothetical protein